MGSVKALMPWGDRTLVEAWVARFRECGCEQIVVVLGHQATAIRNALPADLGVTWVHNPEAAETGPRESLLLAAAQLEPNQAAWFTPVDVPVVGQETLEAVQRGFSGEGSNAPPLAALPRYQTQTGHPVLAGPDFFAHLAAGEQGDRIDAIFSWATKRLVHVEVDDLRVLGNMNRPADYLGFAPPAEPVGPNQDEGRKKTT